MKQVEITSKVVGRGESEGITSAIPSINLSGFALKSDLLTLEKKFSDFLNVPIIDGTINRWNELETFLAGISEDYNLLSLLNGKADKSYVDTNFVTLGTKQTITGEKNFTGGLKVNGSPIYYDATNKYWKLEGDLLVTGGVTMYGANGTDFGTIYDGLPIDGTTIYWSNGVLKASSSGSTTKYPLSWSGFNQGSYDGSVAQSFYIPTKLSEFVNDKSFATTSDLSGYLPLTGGSVEGTLTVRSNRGWGYLFNVIRTDSSEYNVGIGFHNNSGALGYIGVCGSAGLYPGQPLFVNKANENYQIWHSGNDGADSGLDADLLDGINSENFIYQSRTEITSTDNLIAQYQEHLNGGLFGAKAKGWNKITGLEDVSCGYVLMYGQNAYTSSSNFAGGGLLIPQYGTRAFLLETSGAGGNINIIPHRILTDNIIGNYNAGSATKLKTPRTIWGQSFDGTANVTGDLVAGDGNITLNNNKEIKFKDSTGVERNILQFSSDNNLLIGTGLASIGGIIYMRAHSLSFQYGTTAKTALRISSVGNVLIGTTTDSGYKLDVNGKVNITSQGDGAELLRFNTERPWVFKQVGTEGGANLVLQSEYNAKAFIIAHVNGERAVEFFTGDNAYTAFNTVIRPKVSDSIDLGAVNYYWNNSYINNGYFSNKLEINGIPIYKSQNDVLYIGGNLVVRGGVTMYAENEVDIPSIIDSLPIANANTQDKASKGIASFDSAYFKVTDGWVTLTSAPSSGASTLGELLNVDASINTTASVDRVLYQPAGSAIWTWRELPKDGVVGDYLPLSGGTINGELTVNGTFHSNYSMISSNRIDPLHVNNSTSGATQSCMLFYTNGTLRSQFGYGAGGTYYYNYASESYIKLSDSVEGNTKYIEVSDNTYIGTANRKNLLGLHPSFLVLGYSAMEANIPTYIDGAEIYLRYGANWSNAVHLKSDNSVQIPGVLYFGEHGKTNDTSTNIGYIGRGSSDNKMILYCKGETYIYSKEVLAVKLSSTNMLVYGGITMYSDIRKKTKLQDVELSLSQIANAPLIQHYYNSDQNKTTHVGSIAQYWAGLNDWFCKLDNEGYYTMEIQNAALASAISIARHLEKYESKTDKKIKMLKKRVQELEDKLEKLEGGNYGC